MSDYLNRSRFLSPSILHKYLKEYNLFYKLKEVGKSVNDNPIFMYTKGNGHNKVLIWSQMHGNESTTTKALVDFWMYLESEKASKILEVCTFFMIPQLNPDGSERYTRLNANNIDLNRDAVDLSQPESRVLRQVYNEFKPNYCFNLHGQRTIFTAGDTSIPATVSFLSPSANIAKTITPAREIAMKLIVIANRNLQKKIPNAVGRYNDDFNINCVGDYFTSLGTPTILYEAGHYRNDYSRVFTRERILDALIDMSKAIATNMHESILIKEYLQIPVNFENLRDIEVYNLKGKFKGKECNRVFIQFIEEKKKNDIIFRPTISKIERNRSNLSGLRTIDATTNQQLSSTYFNFDIDYKEESVKLISLLSIYQE